MLSLTQLRLLTRFPVRATLALALTVVLVVAFAASGEAHAGTVSGADEVPVGEEPPSAADAPAAEVQTAVEASCGSSPGLQGMDDFAALLGIPEPGSECSTAGGGAAPASTVQNGDASVPALHILGDADCDDDVDSVDALSVLQHVGGLAPQDTCNTAGEVDCDGDVDAVDALGILRNVAGFPADEGSDCPLIGTFGFAVLTLDKFGDGTVGGDVSCGSDCEMLYALFPADSRVYLEATPDEGSMLFPWSGCSATSADGAYCEVTLTADTMVLATFGSPLELGPSTKVLDAETMQLFLREEGTPEEDLTLYFAVGATAAALLQPGDVILSADPDHAFLRKVNAVSVGPDEIAVETGPGTLPDAFSDGTLAVHQDFEPSGSGAAAVAPAAFGFYKDIPIQVGLSGDNWGLSVQGGLGFGASFDLAVDLKGDVKEFRAILTLTQTLQINSASVSGSYEYEFARCDGLPPVPPPPFYCKAPSITIWAGPIPVLLIQPWAALSVGVEATGEMTLDGAWIKNVSTVGGRWTNSGGWVSVAHNEFTHGSPTLSGSLDAKLYVKASLGLRFNGLAGPYFDAEAYLRANVIGTVPPLWRLYAGIGLGAGVKLDVLKLVEFNWELWGRTWEWKIAGNDAELTVRLDPSFPNNAVHSDPSGISCSKDYWTADCMEVYIKGTEVTLITAPQSSFEVTDYWIGCDSYVGDVCTVTMDSDKEVQPVFASAGKLDVEIKKGEGTVTSDPPGIACGPDCSETYVVDTVVTLTAEPAPGYQTIFWNGCDSFDGDTCTVTINRGPRSASVLFARMYELTVVTEGHGSVHSNYAGIDCGVDCSEYFGEGLYRLYASPGMDWQMDGWEGCDSVSSFGRECVLSLDGDRTVTARFKALPPPLGVTVDGPGTVTSNPPGINCPGDCRETYAADTVVTLTADPAPYLWKFCDDADGNTCTVEMDRSRAVYALFVQLFELTVETQGQGTVAGEGIVCPDDCTKSWASGNIDTLTAYPAPGWELVSWDGCDSFSGNECTVTMNDDRTVTATFGQTIELFELSVTTVGGGTVTSDPPGAIDCPGDCSESYEAGTSVTLTAGPDSGWRFDIWAGCDSVVGNDCTVTMNSARSVEATFVEEFTLTVVAVGDGSVIGTGINCPGDCSETYADGTSVTLTAVPDTGLVPDWEGCDYFTSDTCMVTMDADRSVTATFVAGFTLTVEVDDGDQGYVTDNLAIECRYPSGPLCSVGFGAGETVTLTAVPDPGYELVSWEGCDSVAGNDCTVTMNSSRTVTATFGPV